uniref:General vesicular transport factor p115 n=1 Tax=Aceria tosichella TaxID=561515 RepID=A0A6G1SQG8_9ACAR
MACDRTVAETIETLTDRLQTSTLLEDRRDACRGLRSLAKDYRVEVGAQAMEPLLQTIRNDRQDVEMVNHCLDSLNYIISGPLADSPAATWPESDPTTSNASNDNHHHHHNHPSSHHGTSGETHQNNSVSQQQSHKETSHDLGRELSEIFLKRSENIATIVDTTRDNDFKTRWVVVRMLCGLARHKLEMVQDAILSDPLNLSRLSQLVAEEHELIRNDALVLFVRLTQANQNIQNVLAYENFFDKIIYIIELEGYLDGTVAVVNDCLNILLNMTQYNEANQMLFREGGHIQKLMPFFNSIQTIQWTFEKTACIVQVLQIVDCMVSPSNSPENVRRCQEIMQRCGILDKLCELLTASSMPIGVLSETMNTASDIVKGHLGPNATTVMQTSSMMPIILLGMVKEMCQDQERRISELYNYMHVLHEFVSSRSK